LTVSVLVSLLAIAILAVSTPRQAKQVFAASIDRPQRRALRSIGVALLGCSLLAIARGDDRARNLVQWVGAAGFMALGAALALAIRASGKPRA
jgi:uncharacterized protein YjeT (DUF2065 family)